MLIPLERRIWACAVVLAAGGCSAGAPNGALLGIGAGGQPPANATSSAPGAPVGTSSAGSDNGTTWIPISPGGGAADSGAACRAVVQQAEKIQGRADIVFVVDNSGSMTEEVAAIQSNMNAFSSQIEASGIDVHVILISSSPGGGGSGTNQCVDPTGITCIFVPGLTVGGLLAANGICIAPPLGVAGACPSGDDSNPGAGYMHVRQAVDSHNALAQVQGTFGTWQQMLRPDAAKTIVVVSDDESQVPAADFTTWVNGQALLKSSVFRFSGIFCTTPGSANCANVGTTYSQLEHQTGGVAGILCAVASGQVD